MRSLFRGILFLIVSILFNPTATYSQVVFGQYSNEELALESVAFEPEAKKVTLYEEANVYFKVNGIYADHLYRLKILDENIEDFGDIRILFYKGENVIEDISKLKAQVSYLDGGERKVFKLINKVHIKEVNLGDGYFEYRIAFPNVKKGSILEYSYTKMDRSISLLEGWAFQKGIPALVSKYTFKAPDFFQYQMITQGKILQEVAQISEKKNTYSWTVKNINSLPQEPFIGNVLDYQVRVDGYLFTNEFVRTENLETSDIFYGSWNHVATEYLKDPDVSSFMSEKNSEIKYPTEDFKDSTSLATAVRVFNYVSKNYKANNSFWLEPYYSLKTYLEKKEGNSFDKNLLLMHLLKLEGIDSYLIMVNERGEGRRQLIEKPFINQFHSSILSTIIDGKQIFLDPSDSLMPFGLIPINKLVPRGFFIEKGKGRIDDIVVSHRSGILQLVNLETDSAKNLILAHKMRLTDYEAIKITKRLKDKSFEEIIEEEKIDIEPFQFSFHNQLKDKRLVTLDFKVKVESGTEDVLSLNPFELSLFAKNPFVENERILPVEFDYPMFENFNVSIPIPEGFELLDYPENQVITIPSKGIRYSYQADFKDGILKIVSKTELINTKFAASEYSDLKFIMESIASAMSIPILLKKL